MKTFEQLGAAAKKQYPGKFDDYDDAEVGRQLKANNPGVYDEYQEAKFNPVLSKARNIGAKTLEVAQSVLGYTGSTTAKKVLSPIARATALEDSTKAKLSALEDPRNKQTIGATDVLDITVPGLSENIAKHIGELITNPTQGNTLGKVGARVAIDSAFDPLTYFGVGGITRYGKILKAVHEAKLSGNTIKLDSKLALEMAKEVGQAKPSIQMIQNFKKLKPALTLSGKIAAKEQSLVSFGPLQATGPLASKLVEPLDALAKSKIATRLDQAIRPIFSNTTGNADYDEIYNKYRNIAMHRAGLKIEDAKVLESQIKDVTRATGKSRDIINKEISGLVEQVIPVTKAPSQVTYTKVIKSALDFHYNDKLVDAKVAMSNAQKAGDVVKAELAAKDVATYNSALNKLHGTYQPPTGVNPELDKISRDIKQSQANQVLAERASGRTSPPLLADIEYLTHALTPETMKAMREKAIREGTLPAKMTEKQFSEHLVNEIRRQFVQVNPEVVTGWAAVGLITKAEAKTIKGSNGVAKMDELLNAQKISSAQYTDAVHTLTIEEVNSLPIAVKEKIFGKGVGAEVFHTDPVYSTTIRNIRGERARTATEFYNTLRLKGLAIEDAIAEKLHPDWVNVKQAELKGYKVAPEIARSLNKIHEFSANPNELKAALIAYDKFHSLTKAWTLAIFPAYHTKNMVGNFWNNWLSGVNNPLRYADAVRLLTDPTYTLTDIYGKVWKQPELLEKFKELGILGHGQFHGDISRTIRQQIESGKWLTLSSRNQLLRGGRWAGTQVENNARMAHAIDKMLKGDTIEHAALSVKKYLFDYGDLTAAERNVFNRVFFFYKWTKENLPLQLHSLVTTPWKYSVPFKAKHEIEQLTPLNSPNDEKHLPEYFKENFPVRIRFDKNSGKYEYFMFNNWLPAADLLKLTHLHDVAAQSLAPLPKEFLQQFWNYDFYFHDKILKTYKEGGIIPGQNTKFIGRNLPTRLVHAAKIIRLLNEVDKMSKEDATISSKMIGILAGKNQNYDPQKGMINNKFRVDEDMKTLMTMLRNKQRTSPMDTAAVENIYKLIQEKAQEY